MKRDKDGLAQFVEYLVECGLALHMREICLANNVSLGDVYLDVRGKLPLAARLEVWWTLMKVYERSPGEIARVFDRDRSSVAWGLRRLYIMADKQRMDVEAANVRALARMVAEEMEQNLTNNGKAVAATGKGVAASRAAKPGVRVADPVELAREDRDLHSPPSTDAIELRKEQAR